MEKHTQGPLEAPGMDGGAYVVCTHKGRGKRRTVAHAYTAGDAVRFAAVPDLVEALEELCEAVARIQSAQNAFGEGTAVAKARAALAKARGEG